jgi:predicted metalloprotease
MYTISLRILFLFIWFFSGCQGNYLVAQQNETSSSARANVKKTVEASVWLLNKFWEDVFQNAGLRYVPPSSVSGYTTTIETQCGKALLDNAFYCPSDRSIQYDKNFLNRLQLKHGKYATYTVMAHEWGHFISYTMNVGHRLSITEELQADCLSGGFIRWLSEQNPEDGTEYVKGAQTLFLMGDEKGTPWFDQRAHGLPEERLRAFFHGYFSGYSACFQ